MSNSQSPINVSPNINKSQSSLQTKILPDKVKCRNYLASLLNIARGKIESIRIISLNLTQDLIDDHINVETFWSEMSKGIGVPKPDLEFLQKNLPDLRLALLKNEMAIDGIVAPNMPCTLTNFNAPPTKNGNYTSAAVVEVPKEISKNGEQKLPNTNATNAPGGVMIETPTNNGHSTSTSARVEDPNLNVGQKRSRGNTNTNPPDVMVKVLVNENGQKSLKFKRNFDDCEFSNTSTGHMDQSAGPSSVSNNANNTDANTTVAIYQTDSRRDKMLQTIEKLDSAVTGVITIQCAKIMDDLISEHDQALGAKNVEIELLKSKISDLKVEHGVEIFGFMKEIEDFETKYNYATPNDGEMARYTFQVSILQNVIHLQTAVQVKSEHGKELAELKSRFDAQLLDVNRKNEEKMRKLVEEANRRNLLLREYQIKWANFNVETEKCLANLLPESIEIRDED